MALFGSYTLPAERGSHSHFNSLLFSFGYFSFWILVFLVQESQVFAIELIEKKINQQLFK